MKLIAFPNNLYSFNLRSICTLTSSGKVSETSPNKTVMMQGNASSLVFMVHSLVLDCCSCCCCSWCGCCCSCCSCSVDVEKLDLENGSLEFLSMFSKYPKSYRISEVSMVDTGSCRGWFVGQKWSSFQAHDEKFLIVSSFCRPSTDKTSPSRESIAWNVYCIKINKQW